MRSICQKSIQLAVQPDHRISRVELTKVHSVIVMVSITKNDSGFMFYTSFNARPWTSFKYVGMFSKRTCWVQKYVNCVITRAMKGMEVNISLKGGHDLFFFLRSPIHKTNLKQCLHHSSLCYLHPSLCAPIQLQTLANIYLDNSSSGLPRRKTRLYQECRSNRILIPIQSSVQGSHQWQGK